MALAVALFALQRPDRRQIIQFNLAIVTLAVIFISPLCALTVALFAARVVHHVLLVAVAAPLLALAVVKLRIPPQFLARLTLLHTAIFWAWHAPDAYVLALGQTPFYWIMQFTLLVSATLMWSSLFAASTARALASLLFLTVQMGLLGALLVFAKDPLYLPHFTTTMAFGFAPRDDQQLAGLIMWVPASVPYLALALGRLSGWLRANEARQT